MRIISLVFVTVAGIISSSLAAELRVLPYGDSQTKPLGGSVVFTCDITGLPSGTRRDDEDDDENRVNYQMKWLDKNNQEIRSGSGNRVYVEEDKPTTKKLYITSINKSDAGKYTCTAVIDGATQKKSVSLHEYQDITFEHAPRIQHPELHTRALIDCRVTGSSSVSWRYKGARLTPDSKYSMEPNGLRIANITREDDGDYTCRAEVESEGRYSEHIITVSVHVRPKITKPLEQIVERTEEQTLELKCEATGVPPPTYEFVKENSVNPIASTSRIKVDSDKGVIKFDPVKYEDSGRYTCRVNNAVGRDSSSGTVKVLVKPKIDSLSSIVETEGQSASLICESRGVPAPTMSFQKINPGLQPTDFKLGENSDGRITVRSPAAGRLELTISSLDPADAGNYTCRSFNSISSDDKKASITVKFRPRLVDNHKTTAYIWPGKTTNITCNVRAEPLPATTWTKDNRELTNNYTFTIFSLGLNNSLQVRMADAKHTWIYGKYHCLSKNDFGSVQSIIEIKKAEVPSYTLNITEQTVEPNKVILGVAGIPVKDVFPLIGYRVEYNGKIQEFDRNGDTITLENLKSSTTYMVEVRPKNEVGPGTSSRKQIRTANIRIPYPIQIISDVVGKAGYEFNIEWNTPSTGGAPIQSYEFKYRKTRLAGDQAGKSPQAGDWILKKYQDDPQQPIRSFNLTGLDPETSYELQIRVKNNIGWSNQSELFSFQTVKATTAEIQRQQAAAGLAIAVGLIIVLLILVIVIDLACYFSRRSGVTAFICLKLCGAGQERDKEKNLEKGDGSKEVLKEPLEEANHEHQVGSDGNKSSESQQNNVTAPTETAETKEDTKLLLSNEKTGDVEEVVSDEPKKPIAVDESKPQQHPVAADAETVETKTESNDTTEQT